MKTARSNEISYTLLRLVAKIDGLNKKIRNYGTRQKLTEAEIHMIKLIKEHPDYHVTGLAEILEVTKGAVSQLIVRLERKKMISKAKDDNNRSRLVIRLTKQGETAYAMHELLHRQFNELLNEAQSGASEEEKAFLYSFLHSLEEKVDRLEE